MSETILIIGASGLVGSNVARLTQAKGHQVRTTTSRKENANRDAVYLNVLTGEGLKSAFKDVSRVFLMSPGGYANHYDILAPLIQEAKRQGVKKVVLMTAMGANADESSGFRRAELDLERSGLNYTIVRPNWFMDNFTTFWIHGIKTAGLITLPVGDAKTSFIDSRDIANVIATVLNADEANDRFRNQEIDLTGPEALDHVEVAAEISKQTGKRVRFEEHAASELKAGLTSAGLKSDYADFLLLILSFLKAGYSERTTTSVKDVTGQEPRTFAAYVRENVSKF